MSNVKLVGILNVTPDSFSDGGQYEEVETAIAKANELFAEGADIVDVGAESTNPKAGPISLEEEWRRLQPVLDTLLADHPHDISVDSYHPETIAKIAARYGNVFIANDVTGMNSEVMRKVVAQHALRCIVSHLPARFGTDIHAAHGDATMDDIHEVQSELLTRRQQLIDLGVAPDAIILDPGIGFGKTMELNERLLEFSRLVPESEVMIGYSRKRFLGENRFTIEVNLAAARIAIAAGARYLRVHDVAAHVELLKSL